MITDNLSTLLLLLFFAVVVVVVVVVIVVAHHIVSCNAVRFCSLCSQPWKTWKSQGIY